ncbi:MULTISPECIES: ABC transporter substrate-binding protein [unclassified Isoptericola]|uniref:ABC transporter substrate-binding protein n=1 Tax=unclassified Isoptericola TaxID=2623355 RepID=UPI003652E351
MSKKTFVSFSAAAAAVALLAAGCTVGGGSDTGDGGTDDVTLTLLTFETPNLDAEYWDASIERANKLVPGVTIEKLVAPTTDRDAYARQLDSTGELPDIMVAVNPTGLAEAGKLAEFSQDELSHWIDPTANSFDGKIYQLPTNTQTIPNVYYSKAAFEKAGIDEVPTTWDALLDAAEKLKSAGITPFIVNGGGSDTWANIYPLTALVGTDVYAEDPDFLGKLAAGEADFSDPKFAGAVSKLKELVDKGYIDPSTLAKTYAEGQEAFLGGDGGMYPMGSWFTVAPTAEQQEDLGVFPWPSDDGSLVMPTYTGGGLSVSASAPDVDKAKEWAIAWSQVPENLEGGVLADGLFVALKDFDLPDGTTKLYDETLSLYQEAESSGTVTAAFGNEGGIPALPAGFTAEVNSAIGDLVSGRTDVDGFVEHLNSTYAELTQ